MPFVLMMLVGIIPGLQLLVLAPWAWLVTPPALVLGRPLFNWTDVGYQPQSAWALVAMLAFWIVVSLVLALVTTWLMRNAPEPVATKPGPPPARKPEPEKAYPPAIEVVFCPACRATNAPSATCFRCGAPLS
ncbi:MAG: hypothetical protein ACT4P4_06130 [Betaproteobacteria bacterium]